MNIKNLNYSYLLDNLNELETISSYKELIQYYHAFFNDKNELYTAVILEKINYINPIDSKFTNIFYVNKGNCNFEVSDEKFLISTNEILILNAHSNFVLNQFPDSEIIHLCFKKEFFNANFMSSLENNEFFYHFINLCRLDNNFYNKKLVFKGNHSVEKLIIFLLLNFIIEENTYMVRTSLLYFFSTLVDSSSFSMNEIISNKISKTKINLILKYIHTNCSENISLEDLSKKFNYHPNYISSIISSETNKTFQEHLRDARLQKSLYFIQNTNMPIKYIAYRVGYSSTSFFYKAFKDKYNLTPKEFRDLYKND